MPASKPQSPSGDLTEVPETILEAAREVIDIEIEGLDRVRRHLGEGFVRAVRLILQAKGRVVVTGIGKSGLIGRKIVATLASTGTPAMFLHPVEAVHGDLGMVVPHDVVIALSNSGETSELNALLPVFRDRGIALIAFTGNPTSTLARASQAVVDTGVNREACTLGLAPTASTTAALALGDALAVILLNARQFNEADFRRNHPAGSLGERLTVQVRTVMLTGDAVPVAREGDHIGKILEEMDRKGLGSVLILDETNALKGIVTDGDLRRTIVRCGGLADIDLKDLMTVAPKRVRPSAMAAEALALMERHLITVLPVVGDDGELLGIVHLHDLLGKGQFRFTV